MLQTALSVHIIDHKRNQWGVGADCGFLLEKNNSSASLESWTNGDNDISKELNLGGNGSGTNVLQLSRSMAHYSEASFNCSLNKS